MLIGISAAFILTLAWVTGTSRMIRKLDVETLLVCATVSVSLTPFLLPKMHERYFYLMDVFTFLLACCIPNLRLPAFLAQVSSVLTYPIYLFSSAELVIQNWKLFLLIAVSFNIVLVGYLLWKQYIILKQIRPVITETKAVKL
jgi:Gpi18-like mannosyltransferase